MHPSRETAARGMPGGFFIYSVCGSKRDLDHTRLTHLSSVLF